MRRRAEYRNEVKTRLEDEVYSALQEYKRLYFVDSDSAAVARLLSQALLGILPRGEIPVSANAGRIAQME